MYYAVIKDRKLFGMSTVAQEAVDLFLEQECDGMYRVNSLEELNEAIAGKVPNSEKTETQNPFEQLYTLAQSEFNRLEPQLQEGLKTFKKTAKKALANVKKDLETLQEVCDEAAKEFTEEKDDSEK